MPKELLDNNAAAKYLGISPATLNTMRCRTRVLTFVKIGRRVLYLREDLDRFIEERRRRSTSDETDSALEARP